MTTKPRHRDLLGKRLREAFTRHEARELIADQAVAFTGADLERARALWLEAAGDDVPEGGYVGVRLPPSAVQALAVLVVLAGGRVPVVLDPWNPELPRLDFLHGLLRSADDAGLEPHRPSVSVDRRGHLVEQRHRRPVEAPPPAPAAAGLVLFTSGSEGEPKGVVLPAEGLLYVIDHLTDRFRLGPETRAAVTLPLHHTMGLNTQLLPTVLAGGRALILATRLGLKQTYRNILDSEATFVSLFADILGGLATERNRGGLVAAAAVSEVQLAGGMIQSRHLDAARELFPAARIHKGYGLTEAIRVSMIDNRDPRFSKPGAGYVLDGQEVAIQGPRGEEVPRGTRGEICVRGPNVMLGYIHRGLQPLLGGWLATGDAGYLAADGRLVVEGRRDRQFKSHGRHVAPLEIEGAALSSAAVAAAACIPVSCSRRGRRPVIFIEPVEPLTNARKSSIEAVLLGRLQSHKVPKDIVVLGAIPRSAAGKVDVAALARLWQERPGETSLGRGAAGCRFVAFAVGGPEAAP